MISTFKQLSRNNPYESHYNKDNLLDISEYDNQVILDLFDVFASICYCDFYSKRDEDKYIVFNINIPVTNPKLFSSIKDDLQKMLKFMTNGENWNVNFSQSLPKKIVQKDYQETFPPNQFDSIALLSGGLDALAGASQELNNNVLFVTFETNSVEKNKATNSSKYISNSNSSARFVSVPKFCNENYKKYKHSSQRTRSLIFIASTFLYADYYNVKEVKIYENGIMTLNPTFNFRRRVTRTTHPRTLYYINRILTNLKLDIKVINPFNFMTKAEVLNLIPNEWNDLIINTKSCSKMPGSKSFGNRKDSGLCQCGICAACMLRQISILSSEKYGMDTDYITPFNLSSLEKIVENEKSKGNSKNINKISDYAYFKFAEKQSLMQYYREFKLKIENGEIYRYLELSPMLFEDINYREKYEKMLSKFAEEIDFYDKHQE